MTTSRRVLRDAVLDPRARRGLPLFFKLGSRHPDVAFATLRNHLVEVKGHRVPSRRSREIGMGVARSLWAAILPKAMTPWRLSTATGRNAAPSSGRFARIAQSPG